MSDASGARRYARALMELGAEAGVEETIERDLTAVVEAFTDEGGELLSALCNPVFSFPERKKVLDVVLPRLGVHPLTQSFLSLVAERGRMAWLPAIHVDFSRMMDTRAGRVRVSVSTVDPLSPGLEAELKTAFEKSTGKTVVLDARIDPSLIGGMVARIGGRVYDASIRSRLEDIKHRLINAQAAPEA